MYILYAVESVQLPVSQLRSKTEIHTAFKEDLLKPLEVELACIHAFTLPDAMCTFFTHHHFSYQTKDYDKQRFLVDLLEKHPTEEIFNVVHPFISFNSLKEVTRYKQNRSHFNLRIPSGLLFACYPYFPNMDQCDEYIKFGALEFLGAFDSSQNKFTSAYPTNPHIRYYLNYDEQTQRRLQNLYPHIEKCVAFAQADPAIFRSTMENYMREQGRPYCIFYVAEAKRSEAGKSTLFIAQPDDD